MAVTTGILGTVVATDTFLASLLTGIKEGEWSYTENAPDEDTEGFSDLGIPTAIKTLYDVTWEFSGVLAVPTIGALGSVTFSAGYVTNLNAWTLEISAREHEVTAFGATETAWIPGGVERWGGTFSGFYDDTTTATHTANSSEPASGVFKYQEQGAVDNTLTGSIFTTGANIQVSPKDANRISYNYRGSGSLTQSTPSAGTALWTAGAVLAVPVSNVMQFTATTGQTFGNNSTEKAFWTRIAIDVGVKQATRVTVSGRWAGPVTIA